MQGLFHLFRSRGNMIKNSLRQHHIINLFFALKTFPRTYILKVLVLALFIFLTGCGQKAQPYVLLVSFDGFRWDYADRGITPNLNAFIAKGVRAKSLKPSFPTKTFPNHYSIVTGLYPENHGIILNSFSNPETGERFSLGDTSSVRDGKWYKGEAVWTTLKKQGIKTASFFWPGSEVHNPERRPDYFKRYQHSLPYGERIDGIISWLSLPIEERPKFITLYFHETDSRGHDAGPDSPAVDKAIVLLDSLFGVLLNKINKLPIADDINIIVVSDHGMSGVVEGGIINVNGYLPGKEVKTWGSGPLMMIDSDDDEVYSALKKNETNFTVYKKSDVPPRLHFSNHPSIWPLVVLADPGYLLASESGYQRMLKYSSKGNHGYDNDVPDMHGIFFASGSVFREGYRTETVRNIDIYPLICRIFDVKPAENIDGDLDRIGFMLNEID